MVKASLKKLGFDGAIANTVLARLVNIVGSTGTVLLIVHFLSPVEQGYYYTLLSLVSLQMVFELGFSFVIQQLAAHECVHLQFGPRGTVSGEPSAHARLASVLQLSFRWYSAAGLAMMLFLGPVGFLFFARHSGAGTGVHWHWAWFSAVIASSAGLWCMPFYSFLEGCGFIRQVAAMRFRQSVAASLLAWAAMLLHHGLYSPTLVIAGQIGVGALFLAQYRTLLLGLLRHSPAGSAVRWGVEVWPFQWRIAVSWLCSYFTVQAFIPILFALRSPREAGQMGMSLSIAGYMTSLVLPWISTKATPFGRMIAECNFRGLDRLFLSTMRQALSAFAIIAVSVCAAAGALPVLAPRIAARMVSPQLFAVLVLAAGANCVVQSLAILLRSFKNEPYLVQSLVVATTTLVLGAATAVRWGNAGAAFSYLAASTGIGLPLALAIFLRARRTYLHLAPLTACESGAR